MPGRERVWLHEDSSGMKAAAVGTAWIVALFRRLSRRRERCDDRRYHLLVDRTNSITLLPAAETTYRRTDAEADCTRTVPEASAKVYDARCEDT